MNNALIHVKGFVRVNRTKPKPCYAGVNQVMPLTCCKNIQVFAAALAEPTDRIRCEFFWLGVQGIVHKRHCHSEDPLTPHLDGDIMGFALRQLIMVDADCEV
jgi:hypothetical protein